MCHYENRKDIWLGSKTNNFINNGSRTDNRSMHYTLLKNVFISNALQWRIQMGAEGTFAPLKVGQKKKRKSVLISLVFHIWCLKMQNFLGSLSSPALFNIIINITLLKNLRK